jgi:hypothetical protein
MAHRDADRAVGVLSNRDWVVLRQLQRPDIVVCRITSTAHSQPDQRCSSGSGQTTD